MTQMFWTRVSAIVTGVVILVLTIVGLLSGWLQPFRQSAFCETHDCAPPIGATILPLIIGGSICMIVFGAFLMDQKQGVT